MAKSMPEDSSSTDASLIERVRCDDSKAWRDFVDLYGPLAAYWCRKLGIREALVTDTVQDIFLAVLRSLGKYEPSEQNRGFRAWLWGIARHKCIDVMRREGKHPDPVGGSTAWQTVEQIAIEDDEGDPTEAVEMARLLRRAMSQVEDEFESETWQAFLRTTIDGVSTAVVAQELALTPTAVRQYRSRILRRLRRQLGDLP
ncbi:MAG: sigma-70 family RNA polymerase sigma factor [bacterium]|nr:sigma-70 family RNA polymerase sigma factor [bacterium]